MLWVFLILHSLQIFQTLLRTSESAFELNVLLYWFVKKQLQTTTAKSEKTLVVTSNSNRSDFIIICSQNIFFQNFNAMLKGKY